MKGHKYTMAGRLGSSRMNESVIKEGLKKGIVEMGDEVKGLLWKIERSRDNVSVWGPKVCCVGKNAIRGIDLH